MSGGVSGQEKEAKEVRGTGCCLYRHFDNEGNLLYVGIAFNFYRRWNDHVRKSHWFDEVAAITIEHFVDREAVIGAEVKAIKDEEPLYNKLHNGHGGRELPYILDSRTVDKEEWKQKRRAKKLRSVFDKHFPRALMKTKKTKLG